MYDGGLVRNHHGMMDDTCYDMGKRTRPPGCLRGSRRVAPGTGGACGVVAALEVQKAIAVLGSDAFWSDLGVKLGE